ncbi:hypothetical protein CCACVL1_17168 [Corchorus capsularis]|uniref:Uncharacterized protein n=1 Tax=Corchorus capsularis TaxID=210143 RepID=A0A1R3HTT7_COCAP|nr:hypothetical protein CCACVL1_17168 [Corchorus capsularis]
MVTEKNVSEMLVRRGNRARYAPPWHVDFIRQRPS